MPISSAAFDDVALVPGQGLGDEPPFEALDHLLLGVA